MVANRHQTTTTKTTTTTVCKRHKGSHNKWVLFHATSCSISAEDEEDCGRCVSVSTGITRPDFGLVSRRSHEPNVFSWFVIAGMA